MTSKNSRHLDPAEQRRPVLLRASGGKHGRSKDSWRHVTGTVEGNGESATRSARAAVLSAYLIDVKALRRDYGRIRKNAAVGVDGVVMVFIFQVLFSARSR